jgi:hypothetical protein
MQRFPLCAFCRYLRRDVPRNTCDAYPEGIPVRFMSGQENHLVSAEGDHGIQFARADDLPEAGRSLAESIVAAERRRLAAKDRVEP